MNWTAILANGGIIDSPGRAAAVEVAMTRSAAKAALKHRVKASNTKGRTKYPGLKHSAQ